MTIALREKKVGPYIVRELPMRETMRILREHPEGGDERSIAMLGASVINGTGQPIGLAAGELPTGWYRLLMDAHAEVTMRPVIEGEEGGAEGNA